MIVKNFIFVYFGETLINHVNVTSPPASVMMMKQADIDNS